MIKVSSCYHNRSQSLQLSLCLQLGHFLTRQFSSKRLSHSNHRSRGCNTKVLSLCLSLCTGCHRRSNLHKNSELYSVELSTVAFDSSPIQCSPVVSSTSPVPRHVRGRGEKSLVLWYTQFAHAQFSQDFWEFP